MAIRITGSTARICKDSRMAIELIDIDEREVKTLLSNEESHFSDFKSQEIEPSKLSRTIAAFANADGGDLIIGVSDDRRGKTEWAGFPSLEAANAHLQVFEDTLPLGQYAEYQFLRQVEKPALGVVLRASVRKTPDIRRATNGEIYIRRGSQNLPVTDAEAIRRLEYAKGVVSSPRPEVSGGRCKRRTAHLRERCESDPEGSDAHQSLAVGNKRSEFRHRFGRVQALH